MTDLPVHESMYKKLKMWTSYSPASQWQRVDAKIEHRFANFVWPDWNLQIRRKQSWFGRIDGLLLDYSDGRERKGNRKSSEWSLSGANWSGASVPLTLARASRTKLSFSPPRRRWKVSSDLHRPRSTRSWIPFRFPWKSNRLTLPDRKDGWNSDGLDTVIDMGVGGLIASREMLSRLQMQFCFVKARLIDFLNHLLFLDTFLLMLMTNNGELQHWTLLILWKLIHRRLNYLSLCDVSWTFHLQFFFREIRSLNSVFFTFGYKRKSQRFTPQYFFIYIPRFSLIFTYFEILFYYRRNSKWNFVTLHVSQ